MFDIKKQFLWSKLKVGLVMTLALFTLFITVFFAGSIENLFSPKVELKAQIQNVKGLRKGAPVWVSGIEVGSVMNIGLHPEYGTIVTLSVSKKALEFLRKDSEASILTMGLLGDKYIELSSGSPKAEPIKPGDMINGIAVIELKDAVEISVASIEKMSDFINKLDHLVMRFEKDEGAVVKFLTDPEIYDNLRDISKTLSAVLHEIKDGQGTIPMLLHDPSLYNRMLTATSSVEEFTLVLNNRQGTLRRLAEDPTLYENLNKASEQLSSIMEKIESGGGIAGELITDKELAGDLKNTITDIRELTKDMKENPKKYFEFSLF